MKLIRTTIITSALLATSLWAFGGGSCDSKPYAKKMHKEHRMMHDRGGMKRGMHKSPMMKMLRNFVELNEAQEQELAKLQKEFKDKMLQKRKDYFPHESNFIQFKEGKFDKDAYVKAINNKEQLRQKAYQERLAMKAEFMQKAFDILTDEQQKLVIEKVKALQTLHK